MKGVLARMAGAALLCLGTVLPAWAATVSVQPGQDLAAAIQAAGSLSTAISTRRRTRSGRPS